MSPLELMQRLAALALLNDRFQVLNLAQRVREFGWMRVYATPICMSAPCHFQSLKRLDIQDFADRLEGSSGHRRGCAHSEEITKTAVR